MDPQPKSLSATNLAVHHHVNCDLYLHNVYHRGKPRTPHTTPSKATATNVLRESHYKRGLEWEDTLFDWLDDNDLLLKVPSRPMDPSLIQENILADDRDHFFISGLAFKPPQGQLAARFRKFGTDNVDFGLAKPDLLEIHRTKTGVTWKVVDAKASKSIKTAHHVQIYFYSLCLQYLLKGPFFTGTGVAGVWLPPEEGFNNASPSTDDIKSIPLSILSPSLDAFLFERLPRLLAQPREQVKWHFNPLCSGCDYNKECRSVAVNEGRIGAMPNISINDARSLQELLSVGEQTLPGFRRHPPGDIEDLHLLLSKPGNITALEKRSPITVKKARRVLALPKRPPGNNKLKGRLPSSILDAARDGVVKVIPRRNFTCPSREDISFVLSLVQDPATPKPCLEFFSLSVFFDGEAQPAFVCNGSGEDLVPALASTIRNITSGYEDNLPSAQFFVWSAIEQVLLQSHLIKIALETDRDRADIQLCIGALAQGASLLQTNFQPVLLSGALLAFLAKSGRSKAEYKTCLERMGLDTTGTVPELKSRVAEELRRLQGIGTVSRKESSQIPRIIVLKKEVERLVALPIPGYWDLRECIEILGGQEDASDVPRDDDVLSAFYEADHFEMLRNLLSARNQAIYDVLFETRELVDSSGLNLLINEARPLTCDFMDICKQPHLSKLFFMQQFEVLSKLGELWSSRAMGCPDAPVIEYQHSVDGGQYSEHIFRLVEGTIEIPSSDSDFAFFDKLLVEDVTSENETPVENLFDDLPVAGIIFPLNKWTKQHWTNQNPRVQEHIRLADVRNIYPLQNHTIVSIRTWETTHHKLVPGRKYRLSPRLVDFTTSKILSTLVELDWQWSDLEKGDNDDNADDYDELRNPETDHRNVPFLQLVLDPHSFGSLPKSMEMLQAEHGIQRLFKILSGLDVKDAVHLQLKTSQHRAVQRILTNRLSIIWGPPGTGKTHTIALSILRLLEVQWRLRERGRKIIFITAMTHAAIDACMNKLETLITSYRNIKDLAADWLDVVKIHRVMRGNDHPGPSRQEPHTHIYAGTLFQLYNFSKAHSLDVDCVVVDEAGQIALAALSLVLRSLSPDGRIIIAGDSEQLAPIFSGSYPRLNAMSLFGSVLDSVMFRTSVVSSDTQSQSQDISTVIQLTENFRLNPDLGEFVSTIYSRRFKPQKVQARKLALALKEADQMASPGGVEAEVFTSIKKFVVGLSHVMLRLAQHPLRAPRTRPSDLDGGSTLDHCPVSLSLVRLKTWSTKSDQFGYEIHVHGEAMVAAALIACIRYCQPEDDIFVATPHRIQREAVKGALARLKARKTPRNSLEAALAKMSVAERTGKVTVDTIERLQGSEASFVICLFSLPESHTNDLGFLLERRRLNVAISRAKSLCILVASTQVLCPPVTVFANEQTTKGFAFLKAFEERAWSYDVAVNVDKLS